MLEVLSNEMCTINICNMLSLQINTYPSTNHNIKILKKSTEIWAYWTPSLLLRRFLNLCAPPPVTLMNLSNDSSAEPTRCCWMKSMHVSMYFVSNLIKCSLSLNSSSSDIWYISPPASWQLATYKHMSAAQSSLLYHTTSNIMQYAPRCLVS